MTTIMALLAAMTTAPSCPAQTGEPVAITSTVLPVYALGGDYHPENSWPAPGEARIGFVRYAWGLLLRSDDPRFTDFDLSPGPIHSRSSGCWFQWENRWGKHGVEAIDTPHIGESGYNDGYTPVQPTNPPVIPGYRFVMADKAYSPDHAWIGLWNADGDQTRSQVIAFTDRRHTTLATLPFRLGGLATLPSPDTPALGMTIVGEGKARDTVPYFQLLAPTGVRVDLPAVDRPALAVEIERTVVMPQRARPIDAYDRNYALTGVGTVVGRYQLATTRQPPAGRKRWFDDPADMPMIFDGGCTQVNVEYDLTTRKVVAVLCNGLA